MPLLKSRKNLSLVPHRKRRKENPTQSLEPLHELINKLPDALLLEIIYRLPRRSAHRFKSVSKHWSSLISDPYFVRGFIHHRHQFNKSNSSDSNSNPFTLMLQYCFRSTKKILVLPSNNSGDCDFGDDFLNFLPRINDYMITASFNDLLLVYSEVKEDFILNFKPGFFEYCVCNPLTKQWITLPHLPFNSNKDDVIVGFTCDPYSCDKEQGCKTHAHYRYKVVRIHSPTQPNSTQLRMKIFSSDTGEWCNSVVSSPRGLNSINSISKNAGVVVCNAMLHWVDYNYEGLQGIVVFDPFNDAERCRYIDPPIGFSSIKGPVSLGVFRGHLRMIQHPSPWSYWYGLNAQSFSIWELEDYDNGGTWCLKHQVYFKDMILEHPVLAKLVKEPSSPIVLLPAFHPNDEKNLLFKLRNYILRCNLQTMVLEIVDELEKTRENLVYNAKSVFLLEQQSWPTPVPPLPLKFK